MWRRNRKAAAAAAGRRRSKFGGLLMERAMEPALAQNEARVMHDMEDLFDRLTRDWNRGP